MNLHRTRIRRLGAKVLVTGDQETIAWVRDRSHRHFEFDSHFVDANVWHIIVGKTHAPSFPWSPLERGFPSAPCTFLFNPCHRVVVIDAPPGPWRKLWTLRLVRDLLRWQLFHEGAIFIHASVVANQSTGVAIVGKKRSGKSTLLLQLLRSRGLGFVAEDDMTIVRKPNGALVALGWPSCLRIRRSMLKYFPDLAGGPDFTHPANNIERHGDPDTALLRMFPEEVAARVNSYIVPEVTLNAIVSTEWDKRATLSPLSRDRTSEALLGAWDILPERRAGFRPQLDGGSAQQWRDCCFNPPLFDFFGTPSQMSKAMLHEIGSTVDGYAFRHNGDPELLIPLLHPSRSSTSGHLSGNTPPLSNSEAHNKSTRI